MDLIASFSSQKIKNFHFFSISGLLPDNEDLVFLFDTGAICPIIGMNSFFPEKDSPENLKKKEFFEKLLRKELISQNILLRTNPLKTASNQEVRTYPCICKDVSISNAKELDFYFDFSFDEISIPLLGSSFIDDCSYNHSIGGNLNITTIKENAGAAFYDGFDILNFNKIIAKFQADSQKLFVDTS